MKKLISIFLFVSLFVIATFLLFADFENYVALHLDKTENLIAFSGLSFVYLLSDIVLPVPSSLIMILNGKILGFIFGSLLSFFAGLTSSSIGFYLGRRSQHFLNRFFSTADISKANKFMHKSGKFAVALSRAIPILSETVAVLSGTTNMRFPDFFIYSLLGHAIVSAVYGWVGAFAADLNGNLITLVAVTGTLLISWLLTWITNKQLNTTSNSENE